MEELTTETVRRGEGFPLRGEAPIERRREQLSRGFARLGASPGEQAFRVLHAGFVAAPLIAGLDKFSQRLTDWDRYLAPQIERRVPMSARQFMRMVGGIEVAAGLLTAVRPKLGSFVVAGWLGGIIGNLLLGRRAYDVALRDFGLMLGAIALGRLAAAHEADALATA